MHIAVFLLVVFLQGTRADGEKRILLNDPDLIHSQIRALESKYQEILTKYTDLSTKYSDLSTKNTDLSTKYADLSTKYTDVSTKYTDLSTKNTALSTKVADLSAQNADLAVKYHHLSDTPNAGSVYIRWGRKDCPSNQSELVYSGFAGGSWYDHTGAAAEYVCLPRDPDLTTKFSSSYAHMFGAEYGTSEFGFPEGNDAPCAVCRSTTGSTVLMIPGKSTCYSGWTMQYHGDLVAGADGHKAASQYICLDEHPEALTAGQDDHNGKLINPVLAYCGSLACPPYHSDRYLTCVVCTK